MFSFFKKTILGIDIADRSIEIVQLNEGISIGGSKKSNKIFSIERKGRMKLDSGTVERGRIKDSNKLKKALTDLLDQNKINLKKQEAVIFGLPGSQTYTHAFKVEKREDGDYKSRVADELFAVVPLRELDMTFAFTVMKEDEKNADLLAVAAPIGVVEEWQKFFAVLGVPQIKIGSEILASFYGLLLAEEALPVAVADIGSVSTSLGFFDAEGMKSYFSFNFGGDHLTKIISEKTKMAEVEAEKEKEKLGMSNPNPEVVAALSAGLEKLAAEIKNALDYTEKQKGIKIKSLLVVGGSSQLVGLMDFLQKNIVGTEVVQGTTPLIKKEHEIAFLEAAGLARAGFDKGLSGKFPIFSIEKSQLEKSETDENDKLETDGGEGLSNDGGGKDQEREIANNLARQKKILIGIVVLGVIAFGAAFWYRMEEQSRLQAEKAQREVNLSVVQSFIVSVPIAVEKSEYESGRVQGRLLTDSFEMRAEESEAVSFSFVKMSKELAAEEKMWDTPADAFYSASSDDPKADTKVKKYTIIWIAYNDKEANALLTGKVDNVLKDTGVRYALNNIKKQEVKLTEEKNIYSLTAEVAMSMEKEVGVIKIIP
jgi:Tfp pilus assembly PilM family ATPase